MLKAQLAQSASLNSNLLESGKVIDSYLFSPQEARLHDLDSILHLAQNGLQLLISTSGSKQLRQYKESLLTPSAKFTDRTKLSAQENTLLDGQIENLLFHISPFLTEQSASRIIEWLVRRYRVNEFNVDALLTVFLPYHHTIHFVKLVSILHISENSPWLFIASLKKASVPLQRESIVKQMASNPLFAALVLNILPKHINAQVDHRTLISFNIGVFMDYTREGNLSDKTLTFVLPTLVKPLPTSRTIEVALGSLVLLGRVSQQVILSKEALSATLSAVASTKAKIDHTQLIAAIYLIIHNQTPLESLPGALADRLLAIENLGQIITKYTNWSSSDAFLRPVVGNLCLCVEQEVAISTISHLLFSEDLSASACQMICHQLWDAYTHASPEAKEKIIPLLRRAYQLFPAAARDAAGFKGNREGSSEDELGRKDMFLSLVDDNANQQGMMNYIHLSSSADPVLRAKGVHGLLKERSPSDAYLEELNGVEAYEKMPQILLSTVSDPDLNVLQELYRNPGRLVGLVPYDDLIHALESVLSVRISPELLSIHISFLCRIISPQDMKMGRLGMLLFPFLLVTKAAFKRSSAAWKAVQDFSAHDSLLSGVSSLIGTTDWKAMKGDVSDMAQFNTKFVDLLAENVVKFEKYDEAIKSLLNWSVSSLASAKVLALVVLYSVLNAVTGARKLDLGLSLIQQWEKTTPDFEQFPESKKAHMGASLQPDFIRLVTKTEKPSTAAGLISLILLTLPTVQRPSNEPLNWFIIATNSPEDRYLKLCRAIYCFTNGGTTPHLVLTKVLRGLFVTLQDDSLLLLATIWSDSSLSNNMRTVALRHTEAFIRALINQETNAISQDLQTIFPIFLTVLYDPPDKGTLEAAITCVSHLAAVKPDKDGKAPPVYGAQSLAKGILDAIKFLEWKDFLQYVGAIAARAENLGLEAGSLQMIQKDILQFHAEDSTKTNRFKRRLLSYLLSHASAWPNARTRYALIMSTSTVQDPTKLRLLINPIRELSVVDPKGLGQDLNAEQQFNYLRAVLYAVGDADKASFKADGGVVLQPLLDIVGKAVGHTDQISELDGLSTAMTKIVYLMDANQKLHACQYLLSLTLKSSPQVSSIPLNILAVGMENEDIATTILRDVHLPTSDEQPSKRIRRESTTDPLSKLSAACQALCLSRTSRSTQLLAILLSTLESVSENREPGQATMIHIQQTVMYTLDHIAQYIPPEKDNNTQLRIDVLVKLIKDSENPQIVHQALLLIASLAKWSSNSILHHLMPILLSAGNYISPRDDAYSVRVSEKTIESVVPVLTTHLRAKYTKKNALQLAFRPYLEIFVDAAATIPLHRRAKFFLHLVKILGPEDFTLPVCLLLLGAQETSDVGTKRQMERNELAILIIQSQDHLLRFKVLSDLLDDFAMEVLLIRTEDPSFLSSLRGETIPEESLQPFTNVAAFVAENLKSLEGSGSPITEIASQNILPCLMRILAALNTQSSASSIRHHISTAISEALGLVSASDMVLSCLNLLESDDISLQIELYKLVAQRLPNVNTATRSKITPSIQSMIRIANESLSNSRSNSLSAASMQALQSVTRTSVPEEMSLLLDTVPSVVNTMSRSGIEGTCCKTLQLLCATLGPRIILHLTVIIQTTCTLLRDSNPIPDQLLPASMELLSYLSDSVSSFWSNQNVKDVIQTYLDLMGRDDVLDKGSIQDLGRHLARRLPMQIYMGALDEIKGEAVSRQASLPSAEVNLLFTLLRPAIKAATKKDVEVSSRALLGFFMDAWDTPQELAEASPSIRTFIDMIIKLNETSFNPLFRIIFDWAWTAVGDSNIYSQEHRAVAYCTAMGAAQGLLKGLMTPYMAPLVGRATEVFNHWSQAPTNFGSFTLWRKLLEFIKQSVDVDNGGFWRDEHVRLLGSALTRQIPLVAAQQKSWMLNVLGGTLSSMGHIVIDNALLKSLIIDLLMHTRSDEASVRICALQCAAYVWNSDGSRLAGLKSEAMAFLHECAEDENEDVVTEARKMKQILDKY